LDAVIANPAVKAKYIYSFAVSDRTESSSRSDSLCSSGHWGEYQDQL